MAYQSLYRKWRPQTFEEIVGQEHVTKTLQNEIVTGHVSHAYLFCGSRGTGKTTAAKVFSKAVNCKHPVNGSPCNQCETCLGISDGSLLDVIEIDAASNNGVDNIRDISTEASYMPSGVKYKVYIIDEVHMLTMSAFNALLKTLEEPPSHVIFILATTESHKVPATILSRCQRFDFRYVSDEPMYKRLKTISDAEGFEIDDLSLRLIIRSAKGGMRDAISMLDQCAAYDNGRIKDSIVRMVTGVIGTDLLLEMGDAILSNNIEALLTLEKKALDSGYDATRLIDCLCAHFRNLVVSLASDLGSGLIEASSADIERIAKQAEKFGTTRALFDLETLMSAYETAKWAENPRLVLDTALIRIAHPKADKSYETLLKRIEVLEAKLSGAVIATKEETEEEEEEYVPYIPEDEELPLPAEEPEKPAGELSLYDCWEDIVDQLEKDNGTLLAMAVRTGSFRLKDNRLTVIGVLSYMQNADNKAAIKRAVKDISGMDVEVEFESEKPVECDLSAAKENDPLAALANKLSGKINIIS